jgi:hypothetical protein
MRRARAATVFVLLALPVLSPPALATPSVRFSSEATPIPHFPGTGLKLGAGAAVKSVYKITGTEYEGSPPPLEGVNFYLPAGTRLHTAGFPTCKPSVLEPTGPGPEFCPKASSAGPIGEVRGFVTLGSERVRERATLQSFYAPGGGLEFFTAGHSPVALEILSVGRYTQLGGGGGYGPKLVAQVPLVQTVPGGPYVSVEVIGLQIGSAMKQHGKTVYYGTLPSKCPKKYFPVKSELIFAAVGGLPRQVVTVTYKSPCPKHH